MEWGRVANNETFVDRIDQLMKEIIVLHDRHLIDECLVLYVFIVFVGSRNTLPLVG